MAKKQNDKNPAENLTFEQAIETLGGIVQKIETGQVPLQESLLQYEQGMSLIQHCRKILLDAEKRIELIGETRQSAEPTADSDQDDADDSDDEEAGEDAAVPSDSDDPDDETLF